MKMPTWIKPAIWGGVIGGAGLLIVGFGAGFVTTSGSANQCDIRHLPQRWPASISG